MKISNGTLKWLLWAIKGSFLGGKKRGEEDVANEQNLMPVEELNSRTTPEERIERARKAGIASGEARRRKKSMKDTAKMLMEMQVVGETNKRNLKNFGVAEEDQNYQTAIIVRLLQRGLIDGDTASIRTLAELTGDLGKNGFLGADDIVEMEYPTICIPSNGRDKVTGNVLAPQAGPQTMFMTSEADVIIYGGAAGGGKTHALLLEGVRHKDVKDFQAAIFRRTYTQISAPGGLWDASRKIYSQIPGANSGKAPKLHWDFENGLGGHLTFSQIGSDDDLENWQGTEIAYIGFDELTHFTKHQFLYMLSRNRSTCGIRPYVRATCNPDADSWVAEYIEWWIDQETGYPIKERSGHIRWMLNLKDVIYWFESKEDGIQFAIEQGEELEEAKVMVKSVTFIASTLYDNKILMERDPGYLANLKALTEVDMERLLYGNWKIKAAAGAFFQRTQIGELLDKAPDDIIAVCRGWDLAATDTTENQNAAFTAGVLMGKRENGRFVVLDVINQQLKAGDVRNLVLNTAKMDAQKYQWVRIRLPQDPGQAGKAQKVSYMEMLAGYDVVMEPESGDKATRAEPMAAQWQHGMFDVVLGEWNEMYFNQLESFPESLWKDMVDASSSAFNEITLGMGFNIDNML